MAIMFFSVGSAWSMQPYVWFTLVSIVLGVLLVFEKSFSWITALGLLLIPCIPFSAVLGQGANAKTVWSPYSKLSIISQDQTTLGKMIVINSNNLGHQFITDFRTREDFYFTPYTIHKPSAYKRILVIGAGSGMDVSTALHVNPTVERIDAVEIDPDIADLGKTMNFNKPYDDPRVHIYIDDGRSFLEHSRETYDLIIFALTDSVIITRSASNIRLESFLFTKEAFALAKSHLSEKGVFTLYNYYRENWLIDRIALMMKQTFGSDPFVKTYGDVGKAAIFLTGPGAMTLLDSTIDQHTPDENTMMATDDWPFLYVKDRTIPDTYRWVLLSIVVIVGASTVWMLKGQSLNVGMLRYFFMGMGFMLLETKQLVTFGLLFGNTWIVNALVFGAIMVSVLAAIVISRFFILKNGWLALVLFGSLLCAYFFPPSAFLHVAPVIRYIIASILYFSPIVAANILFSDAFKDETNPSAMLAVNMFGTIIGGIIEYTAMITGYAFLTWIIMLCYAIVFTPLLLKRR